MAKKNEQTVECPQCGETMEFSRKRGPVKEYACKKCGTTVNVR